MARTIAAVLVVGLVALAASRTGLVTADDLGPLVADPEIAADRNTVGAAPPSSLDGLPAVDHAGFRVALVEARAVPDNRTGRPIIVADLAVRNDVDVPIRISRPMLRLIGPDDSAIEASRFDYSLYDDRLAVGPGAIGRALAVFVLPRGADTDLALHRLEIGEPGRWPSNLPLDGETGPVLPVQEIMPLGALGEPGPIGYRGTTVELVAATVDVGYGSYRARVGQHVLALIVEIDDPAGTGAELLKQESWQLLSTDDPGSGTPDQQRALRVIGGDGGPVGEPTPGRATLIVVFTYSTEATDLVVVLGPDVAPRPLARFEVPPVG